MDIGVPITEAKGKLNELVRVAEDQPVFILRHSRPVGVLLSPARFNALIEELEDALDRLSIYESQQAPESMRIPWEKVETELGIR
ncbi:MAG: type II toxin-antitoxin system Phd/YefM family antitoxin [Acidimicrobiia bacterium]|jgi:prevent-host-death family protein